MFKTSMVFLSSLVLAASAAVYNVNNYGAKGDGTTNNRTAIQNAVNAAFNAGGGMVQVPAGTFLTGSIEIKSNVTLQIDSGATIKGSPDTSSVNYPRIYAGYQSYMSWPAKYPEKALVWAKNAHHIAITGSGTIDGNGLASGFYTGTDIGRRPDMVDMVRIMMCHNVRVEGASSGNMLYFTNANHWNLKPMNCDTVHIQYLKIVEKGGLTPDGMPISDCRNVVVEDCDITADDDAITLKNGSPYISVENITIRRTTMRSTSSSIKFGSPQSYGPYKNIRIIGCTFERDQNFSTNYGHFEGATFAVCNGGGSIDGILLEDCVSGIDSKVNGALGIYLGNTRSGTWAPYWWEDSISPITFGSIKNVTVRNMNSVSAKKCPVMIEGRSGSPIENVTFESCYLNVPGGGSTSGVPAEKTELYPYAACGDGMYGDNCSWGFFLRHVKNITFKNVYTWTNTPDGRPCVYMSDVMNIDTSGLYKTAPGTTDAKRKESDASPALNITCNRKSLSFSMPQRGRYVISIFTLAGSKLCAVHGYGKAGLNRVSMPPQLLLGNQILVINVKSGNIDVVWKMMSE